LDIARRLFSIPNLTLFLGLVSRLRGMIRKSGNRFSGKIVLK